ncbi:MAG: serine protease [Dehalococcoidia bacterium]
MNPADATPPLPDFRDLASRIARTRNDFERVYEQVRASAPGTRAFKTVGAGAVTDQVAFERALRQAAEERWFVRLGERLIQDGFLPDPSTPRTDLQKVISAELGFPDATVVEGGTLRARGRLCKIEVAAKGGRPDAVTGTGFLVGPSAVLTSFHVVADLVNERTGALEERSDRRLRVRFDHATGRRDPVDYKVPPSWLVAWKPPHDHEIAITNGIPSPTSPAGGVDLRGFLDFAVIVVVGSPGSERGYYDLAKAVKPVDGRIYLFQHPMGLQQRIADGRFAGFRDGPGTERIDHTANAERGSSGGLLLDGDYELVGLHQGSHGEPVVNTGISAIAIRDEVLAQKADLLDAKYVQAFRVADDSRPILGRSKCQEWARRTSKALVRVKPPFGNKGVSFTKEIMQACLPGDENVIRSVEVRDLDSDALKTATTLLTTLGVDATGLPTEADADTTRGAWHQTLAADFGARIEKAHRGRVVWLVIDDLQKKERPIPDGSVRDFLSELYRRSSSVTNLRIVLLGLTDLPSGFPTGSAHDEDIAPPQLADIVSYVRFRLTVGGIDHSAAEAHRLARLIEVSGGADIISLSDYVAEKVDRVLNEAIEASP